VLPPRQVCANHQEAARRCPARRGMYVGDEQFLTREFGVVGGACGEPAGAEHVGGGPQARDQVVGWDLGPATRVPSASGRRPLRLRARHALATGMGRIRADGVSRTLVAMTPEEIADLAHLRRARDLMDRGYAQPLDVPAMARAALMSPAHFSRKFRAAYAETPYSYLMTRRIERAKALLRQGMSVTDACMAVGCTSLGSFSSRFTKLVGETPSQYRARDHRDLEVVPACVIMVVTRPRLTPIRTERVGGQAPTEQDRRSTDGDGAFSVVA
jgi:AraC-like DNA-binding protein